MIPETENPQEAISVSQGQPARTAQADLGRGHNVALSRDGLYHKQIQNNFPLIQVIWTRDAVETDQFQGSISLQTTLFDSYYGHCLIVLCL